MLNSHNSYKPLYYLKDIYDSIFPVYFPFLPPRYGMLVLFIFNYTRSLHQNTWHSIKSCNKVPTKVKLLLT